MDNDNKFLMQSLFQKLDCNQPNLGPGGMRNYTL